jgi:hypothetical protein
MLPTTMKGLSCKALLLASCATLALLTSGCSQMQTQCATDCINEGVPYYLPKKLARVTVLKTESGNYDAKLIETAPVADPQHFYVAKPQHHIFRSDMVDLRTTPEGLMSSAFVTSERRNATISDNILFNTAFYNKDGLKDQLVRGMRDAVEVNYAVDDCEPGCKAFEAVFDPSSCEHVSTINGHIKRYGMSLEVSQAQQRPSTPGVVDASGVVVRPTVLSPMCVRSSKDGNVVCSLGGITPSDNPLFNIPTRNGFFSKNTANVEMREGTLTGYYSRKPSEVAGMLQTTAETAEDVARIAGAIIAPIAAAVEVKETASDQTQTSEKTGATQAVGGGGGGSGTNLADIYLTDRVIDTIDEDDDDNDDDDDGECDFPNTTAAKRSKLRRLLRY